MPSPIKWFGGSRERRMRASPFWSRHGSAGRQKCRGLVRRRRLQLEGYHRKPSAGRLRCRLRLCAHEQCVRRLGEESIALTGSGALYANSETIIEATYVYQAAPWWTLQPDVQYVSILAHPFRRRTPVSRRSRRTLLWLAFTPRSISRLGQSRRYIKSMSSQRDFAA